MHEYSVAQALVEQVEQAARDHPAAVVQAVHVRLGAQSGVAPDLLLSAYGLCREGTACAAAALEIESVPARWACPACGYDVPAGAILRCPVCARPARLVRGDEIVLARIELEVADV